LPERTKSRVNSRERDQNNNPTIRQTEWGRVQLLHSRRPVTLVTGIIGPALLTYDMAGALEFEKFAEECIRLAKRSANRHNRHMMWRMAAACLLIAQVLTECEKEQGVNSRLADLARHLH